MHPTITAARELIDTALGHVPARELERKTPGGHWSPAQILEHLRLSCHFTTRAIDRMLAGEGRPLRAPSVAQRLARWVVVDLGYFPKVVAPPAVSPGSAPLPATVLADALQALVEMDAALERAVRQLGEDGPVANHPRFAAMSAAQWRKFHLVHTRHHVKQATQRLGTA